MKTNFKFLAILFLVVYGYSAFAQKNVSTDAAYPDGEMAMMDFMVKNLKYPSLAKENGITGIVYIDFVVDTSGTVTNTKIRKDIGGGCGQEALRVIRMMPQWKPALNNGQAVRTYFTLPISFFEESGKEIRKRRKELRKAKQEKRKN